MKSSQAILLLAALTLGVIAGVLLQREGVPGAALDLFRESQPLPQEPPRPPEVKREEVPFSDLAGRRVFVILTFGQSNSANHGAERHASSEPVFNFFLGKIYRAADPLLGSTGDGGSVWTRLGDLLVRERLCDAAVFVPIGVGNSVVRRWAPRGDLHPLLLYTLRDCRASGLGITHVFWHQGETDTLLQTSRAEYRTSLEALIATLRYEGVEAPVFVCAASRHRGRVSEAVRQGQRDCVATTSGVFAGPDTDLLVGPDRAEDQVHFSGAGLDHSARLWVEAVRLQQADPANRKPDR